MTWSQPDLAHTHVHASSLMMVDGAVGGGDGAHDGGCSCHWFRVLARWLMMISVHWVDGGGAAWLLVSHLAF